MSFADPYLVTQFLHPRANAPDPLFPESIPPDTRWGIANTRSASTFDPDSYQDRFIPNLHAHVGFYLHYERPVESRIPDCSITVTMILDLDSVAAAVDFAKPLMIQEDAHLEPNIGGACKT